eukprot:gene57-69_t
MVKASHEIKSLQPRVQQYQIVGRAAPTEKKPEPKIFRMKLFARNVVMARAKFWYFMKKICKAKKTGGEVLTVSKLSEAKPLKVKNFGVWLRYDSRSGVHNMYKEYRALTLTDAIGAMYGCRSVQILKTAEIQNAQCRRPHVTEMHKSGLKFPVRGGVGVEWERYGLTSC